MTYFDCNVHLDQFPSPLSIIREYEYFDINYIINLCDNLDSLLFLRNLFKGKKNLFFGLGLHPNKKYSNDEIQRILNHLKKEIRITGECGLDFERNINPPQAQISFLKDQLEIAKKNDQIIILHCRKAEDKLIEILKNFQVKNFIFHWYSGPIEYIKDIIDLGGFFSFNNCVLYNLRYEKIISKIPLENILTESDAPFMHNNIVTKPEDFPNIIRKLSQIKSQEESIISEKLLNNFLDLLNRTSLMRLQ